jgi:hypothetical protein
MKTATHPDPIPPNPEVDLGLTIPQMVFCRSRFGAWCMNTSDSERQVFQKAQKRFGHARPGALEDLVLKLLRDELPREHFPESFLQSVVDPLADKANYSLDPSVIRKKPH